MPFLFAQIPVIARALVPEAIQTSTRYPIWIAASLSLLAMTIHKSFVIPSEVEESKTFDTDFDRPFDYAQGDK